MGLAWESPLSGLLQAGGHGSGKGDGVGKPVAVQVENGGNGGGRAERAVGRRVVPIILMGTPHYQGNASGNLIADNDSA